MARMVDRSMARMIAWKRIVTGTLSLSGGLALSAVTTLQGRPLTPLLIVALLIFFAGGAWTLRDGLRLRRELQR
jgi:hypothetical protein